MISAKESLFLVSGKEKRLTGEFFPVKFSLICIKISTLKLECK